MRSIKIDTSGIRPTEKEVNSAKNKIRYKTQKEFPKRKLSYEFETKKDR